MKTIIALQVFTFLVATSSASFIWQEEESPRVKVHDIPEAPHTLPSADANLNIYAVPVGQGDLTVIQCPSSAGTSAGKITVIDAGSTGNTGFTSAEVDTYLSGQDYERMIITHPDADHYNYISMLYTSAKTKPTAIYHSCDWATYYDKQINNPAVTAKAVQILKCCGTACSNYFICNRAVTLNIIGSEQASCATNKNGASIVVIIKYLGIRTYLSGDFEGSQLWVDNFVKCVGSKNLRAEIYRLAHHGSHGNDNRESLLDDIMPDYAFVSSGLNSNNNYNHPRCEVSDYLKKYFLITLSSSHPYACFKSGNRVDTGTTKAMFITTHVKSGYYVNDVVKFAITPLPGAFIRVSRKNVD